MDVDGSHVRGRREKKEGHGMYPTEADIRGNPMHDGEGTAERGEEPRENGSRRTNWCARVMDSVPREESEPQHAGGEVIPDADAARVQSEARVSHAHTPADNDDNAGAGAGADDDEWRADDGARRHAAGDDADHDGRWWMWRGRVRARPGDDAADGDGRRAAVPVLWHDVWRVQRECGEVA